MVLVFALTGFIFIGCLHSLWLNMFLKTITAWSHAFANNSHSGKSFFICWRGHKCKWDGVWGGGRFHLEIVYFFFFRFWSWKYVLFCDCHTNREFWINLILFFEPPPTSNTRVVHEIWQYTIKLLSKEDDWLGTGTMYVMILASYICFDWKIHTPLRYGKMCLLHKTV